MIKTKTKLKNLNKKLHEKQKLLMNLMYDLNPENKSVNNINPEVSYNKIKHLHYEIIVLDYVIESWFTLYRYDTDTFWSN